jgi:hypothetical protein
MNRREALKTMTAMPLGMTGTVATQPVNSRVPLPTLLEDLIGPFKRLVIDGMDVGFWLTPPSDWFTLATCQCNDPTHQEYHRNIQCRVGAVEFDKPLALKTWHAAKLKHYYDYNKHLCDCDYISVLGAFFIKEMKSDSGHGIRLLEALSGCLMRKTTADGKQDNWTAFTNVREPIQVGTEP